MKKLYVGNLSWDATDRDLESLFSEFGEVHSAVVINDRETGRSRGFGFVEMDQEPAMKAVQELDGADHMGRNIKVNEAQERSRGGGGGGGGGRRY